MDVHIELLRRVHRMSIAEALWLLHFLNTRETSAPAEPSVIHLDDWRLLRGAAARSSRTRDPA